MSFRMNRAIWIVVLSLLFGSGSAENQTSPGSGTLLKQFAQNKIGSSILLPLTGNVYPVGYYWVSVAIGTNQPKIFTLDIDSGSDLTWVQCDAPCVSCTAPREKQYKPNHNTVPCSAPLCAAVHWPQKPNCKNPKDQCDYKVSYADHSSSIGALVLDEFPVKLKDGSLKFPPIGFGCGYDNHFSPSSPPPPTAGVMGLGNGKASILTQLHSQGLTSNVVGHCLSPSGGGFLFFGDDLIPSSGVTWTPMSPQQSNNHYSAGPAEMLFDGKPSGVKDLSFVFDSGSSYTYFTSKAYNSIITLINGGLKGKPLMVAKEDKTLSVCWKPSKPFQSVGELRNYFKTISLKFASGRNVLFQIPPESYLIISKYGNACLGILNGADVGLQNINVIGDIFMQGLMMIYDNESRRVGWVPANCNRLRS